MGISGQVIRPTSKETTESYPQMMMPSAKFMIRFLAISLLILAAVGCTTSIKFGEDPQFDRLSQLTFDVSTEAEIKAILGEPQGIGSFMSPNIGKKEAWLYESTLSEGNSAKLKMLMIFFDNNRRVYHGHIWFASGALFGRTE